MAPLRFEKLIRCLACVVAVDLAVAVVIIDYRSKAASATTSLVAANQPGAGANGSNTAQNGGILGSGTFSNRRGAGGATTTTRPAGSALGAPADGGASDPGAAAAGDSSNGTGGSRATSGGSSPSTSRTTRPSKTNATGTSPGVTDPGVPAGDSGAPLGGDAGITSVPDAGVDVPATTDTTRPQATTTTTAPKKQGGTGSPNVTLADKTGDTVIDGGGGAISSGRADITKTMVEWTAKAVVLTAQVAQTVDPRQDPNWKSDSTYVDWTLDTNGDGVGDYEVQYYFDGTNMVADVTNPGGAQSTCGSEASYTADGYTAAIDPACLGGASTFTYTVTTYYDTDPANPDGNVASDTGPDSGPSPLVGKPH